MRYTDNKPQVCKATAEAQELGELEEHLVGELRVLAVVDLAHGVAGQREQQLEQRAKDLPREERAALPDVLAELEHLRKAAGRLAQQQ